MRQYKENTFELQKVTCNKCGKELKVENGILKEGCFHTDFTFDYFSKMDGKHIQFDLCEECYSTFTDTFIIPEQSEEITEFL